MARSDPFAATPYGVDDYFKEKEEEEKGEGKPAYETPEYFSVDPEHRVIERPAGPEATGAISPELAKDVVRASEEGYNAAQIEDEAIRLMDEKPKSDPGFTLADIPDAIKDPAIAGITTVFEFIPFDQFMSTPMRGVMAGLGQLDPEGAPYKALRAAEVKAYTDTYGPRVKKEQAPYDPLAGWRRHPSLHIAPEKPQPVGLESVVKDAEWMREQWAQREKERLEAPAKAAQLEEQKRILEDHKQELEEFYGAQFDNFMRLARAGHFEEVAAAGGKGRAGIDWGTLRKSDLDDAFLPLDKAIEQRDLLIEKGLDPGPMLNTMADPTSRVVAATMFEVVADPLNFIGGAAGRVVTVGDDLYRASNHAVKTAGDVARVTGKSTDDVLTTVVKAELGDADAVSTVRGYRDSIQKAQLEEQKRLERWADSRPSDLLEGAAERRKGVQEALDEKIADYRNPDTPAVDPREIQRLRTQLYAAEKAVEEFSDPRTVIGRISTEARNRRRVIARQKAAVARLDLSLEGTSSIANKITKGHGAFRHHIPFTQFESRPIKPQTAQRLTAAGERVAELVPGVVWSAADDVAGAAAVARGALDPAIEKIKLYLQTATTLGRKAFGTRLVQPAVRILGTEARVAAQYGGPELRATLGQDPISTVMGVHVAKLKKANATVWNNAQAALGSYMRRSASLEAELLRDIGRITREAKNALRQRRKEARVELPKVKSKLEDLKRRGIQSGPHFVKATRDLEKYSLWGSKSYGVQDILVEAGGAMERGHGKLDTKLGRTKFTEYVDEFGGRTELLPLVRTLETSLQKRAAMLTKEEIELRQALVTLVLKLDDELRASKEFKDLLDVHSAQLDALGFRKRELEAKIAEAKGAAKKVEEDITAQVVEREKLADRLEKKAKGAGRKRRPALTKKIDEAVNANPMDDLAARSAVAGILKEALKADTAQKAVKNAFDELADRVVLQVRGGHHADLGKAYRAAARRLKKGASARRKVLENRLAQKNAVLKKTEKTVGPEKDALTSKILDVSDEMTDLQRKLVEVEPRLQVPVETLPDGSVKWADRGLEAWEQEAWSEFDELAKHIAPEDRALLAMSVLRDVADQIDVPTYKWLTNKGYKVLGKRLGDLPDEIVPLVVELRRLVQRYESLFQDIGFEFMANPLKMMRAWGVTEYVPHIRSKESRLGESPSSNGGPGLDDRLSLDYDGSKRREVYGAIDEVNLWLQGTRRINEGLGDVARVGTTESMAPASALQRPEKWLRVAVSEAQARSSRGENGVSYILERIAANSDDAYYAALANKLKELLDDQNLYFVASDSPIRIKAKKSKKTIGVYVSTRSGKHRGIQIRLYNPGSGKAHGECQEVILHEALHAATSRQINGVLNRVTRSIVGEPSDELSKAVQDLTDLLQRTKKYREDNNIVGDNRNDQIILNYMFKNEQELVATALTSPRAQELLMSIPAPGGNTAWDELTSNLAKLLGVTDDTEFQSLLDLTWRVSADEKFAEIGRTQRLARPPKPKAQPGAPPPKATSIPSDAKGKAKKAFQKHQYGVNPEVVFTLDPMALAQRYMKANRAISTRELLTGLIHGDVIRPVRPRVESDGTRTPIHVVALEEDMAPMLGSSSRDYDRVLAVEGSYEDWLNPGRGNEDFLSTMKEIAGERVQQQSADVAEAMKRTKAEIGDAYMTSDDAMKLLMKHYDDVMAEKAARPLSQKTRDAVLAATADVRKDVDALGRLIAGRQGQMSSMNMQVPEFRDAEAVLNALIRIRNQDFVRINSGDVAAGKELYDPRKSVADALAQAEKKYQAEIDNLLKVHGEYEKIPFDDVRAVQKKIEAEHVRLLEGIAEDMNRRAGVVGAKVTARALANFYSQHESMYRMYVPRVVVQSLEDMINLDAAAGALGTIGKFIGHDVQNFFKVRLTVTAPMFHGRNALSNVMSNMLDLGITGALNPDTNIRATRLAHGLFFYERFGSIRNAAAEINAPRKPGESQTLYRTRKARAVEFNAMFQDMLADGFDLTGKGDVYDIDELYGILRAKGGVSEAHTQFVDIQHFEKELLENLGGEVPRVGTNWVDSISKSIFDPSNPWASTKKTLSRVEGAAILLGSAWVSGGAAIYLPKGWGTALGRHVENQARLANIIGNAKKTGDLHGSIEHAHKFLFDYNDLNAFQRTIMRAIFPFFTWNQKNLLLQMKMMREKPAFYSQFNRLMLHDIDKYLQALNYEAGVALGGIDPEQQAFVYTDQTSPLAMSRRKPHTLSRIQFTVPGYAWFGNATPNTFASGLGTPQEAMVEWIAPLVISGGAVYQRLAGPEIGTDLIGMDPNYLAVQTAAGRNPAYRGIGHVNFLARIALEAMTGHHSYYDIPQNELTNGQVTLGMMTGLRESGPAGNYLADSLGEFMGADFVMGQDGKRMVVDGKRNWLLGINPWGRMIREVGLAQSPESFSLGEPSTGKTQVQPLHWSLRTLRYLFGFGFKHIDPHWGAQYQSGEPGSIVSDKIMQQIRKDQGVTFTVEREVIPTD